MVAMTQRLEAIIAIQPFAPSPMHAGTTTAGCWSQAGTRIGPRYVDVGQARVTATSNAHSLVSAAFYKAEGVGWVL